MLKSFLNEVDILIILEFKTSFENNIQSFLNIFKCFFFLEPPV